MALMDAGVPITHPAAGVAVGLVSQNNKIGENSEFQIGEHEVLLDILGLEDYLGDMDFKIGGTREGINALQADIKLPGLPFEVSVNSCEIYRNICSLVETFCENFRFFDRSGVPVVLLYFLFERDIEIVKNF